MRILGDKFILDSGQISFIRQLKRIMSGKGINNFMTTQKLFKQSAQYPYNIGQKSSISNSSSPGPRTISKSHHYHLLAPRSPIQDQIDQIQRNNVQEGKNNKTSFNASQSFGAKGGDGVGSREGGRGDQGRERDRISPSQNRGQAYNRVRELVGGRETSRTEDLKKQDYSQRQRKQVSPKPKRPLRHDNSTLNQSPTIQQQSPTTWQTMVIKSSRKYFDSCRSEALEYLHKLSSILSSDHNYLQSSLSRIHNNIESCHINICQNLKSYLYSYIDKALQKWKEESMTSIMRRKLQFMGEIYELNTQVQERYKQIVGFKSQLEEERQWRERVSELLRQSYEEDLVDLSRMCRKAVSKVETEVKDYWQIMENTIDDGMKDQKKKDIIIDRLKQIIQQQCIKMKQISGQQKQILPKPPKQQFPSSPPPNPNRTSYQLSRQLKPQYNTTASDIRPLNAHESPSNLNQRQSLNLYSNKANNLEIEREKQQNQRPYGEFINKVYTFTQQDRGRQVGDERENGDEGDGRRM